MFKPESSLLIVAVALVGCVSTITPPRAPADPIVAFIIRDARHVGLVLVRNAGSLTEFGYGDWDWYAHLHDSWYHVFDTVLWPTQGTLAYRHYANRSALERRYAAEHRTAFRVARRRAVELLERLDTEIAGHADQHHYNRTYDLHFVPYDTGYWFAYNCHDAVAEWCRALDCHVSWVPIRLGLTIADNRDLLSIPEARHNHSGPSPVPMRSRR